jgi:signal transduction histidine kinase
MVKLYATSFLRHNKASQRGEGILTESFTERTAGIWIPTVFYAAGGIYILAFWAVFTLSAYHLLALGIASILVAAFLFSLSKWAYWIGLFTFPLLIIEFLYALTFSVNIAGWNPNASVAAFNASMVAYLVLLCFSFLLLLDRRNILKSDKFMDKLSSSISPRQRGEEKERSETD